MMSVNYVKNKKKRKMKQSKRPGLGIEGCYFKRVDRCGLSEEVMIDLSPKWVMQVT